MHVIGTMGGPPGAQLQRQNAERMREWQGINKDELSSKGCLDQKTRGVELDVNRPGPERYKAQLVAHGRMHTM